MLTATALALILSGAVSGAISILSARRRGSSPWWGALAAGVAYALGHAAVAMPPFPPGEITARIPYLALAASLLSAISMPGQGGLTHRLLTPLGLVSLAYVVMLSPILPRGESSNEFLIRLVSAALVTLLAASNLAWLDHPGRRVELRVALVLLSFGSALVFLMARSILLFQLSLVLSASLLGACLSPSAGLVPVALTVLSALVLESFFYASLSAWKALALAASPSVVWITRLAPVAHLSTKSRIFISAMLLILLLSAVLYL
jgi:hypothetical protein